MDPTIQADWKNREFVEEIAKGIKSISDFLNRFGGSRLRFAKTQLKFVDSLSSRSVAHCGLTYQQTCFV